MKVTLDKKDNVNGIISIDIEKSDYEQNVEKSLNQYRNRANIPGFRQGKVPKQLVRKLYGKSILAEEINKLVSNELFKYIQDNSLNILGEPLPNETEQPEIDFDKDENFQFKFDIALAPEFELALNKKNRLTYYNVKIEDDILDKQIEAYKQNLGTYEKVEEKSVETDLVKGVITELENNEPKAEGIVIENGILMPSYLKDEAIKGKFIGIGINETIVFNPKTAYDNNEAEIASLLHTTKDKVADINSDFSFEVKEITRYKAAEIDQAMFDKVLGEGVASSEEEFRNKIREIISGQFKPAADSLFMQSARELILNKMKDVQFADDFLKKWLLVSNEKNTEESIEKDYPAIVEDLKFHLAKEKIAKENEIKIERADVEKLAVEVTRAQFAQYGINTVSPEMEDDFVKRMLGDANTVRNLSERVLEDKINNWLKETVKVTEEEVTSEEFNKLLDAETTKEVKEEQE